MDNIDQLLAPFIPDIRLLICAYALPGMRGILEDILRDNGDAVLVQWILRELSSDDPNIRPDVAALWWASRWGHFGLVKWLAKRRSQIMILDISDAFDISCEYGQLELAKWFVSEHKLTIHNTQYSHVFRLSCVNGHLETAKWLVSEFGSAAAKDAKTSSKGHFETTEWLISEFGVTDEALLDDKYYAFRHACMNGRIDIAKWLADEFKFTAKDVEASIDWKTLAIIRSASRHILKWLNFKFNMEYMEYVALSR